MARVIQFKKNYISIPIVDENEEVKHELKFYRTDENLERVYKKGEEIEELHKQVGEDDNDAGKKVLKAAFDEVFGEGNFDAIYEFNPSTVIILEYFIMAIIIIHEELREFNDAKALEKYLK